MISRRLNFPMASSSSVAYGLAGRHRGASLPSPAVSSSFVSKAVRSYFSTQSSLLGFTKRLIIAMDRHAVTESPSRKRFATLTQTVVTSGNDSSIIDMNNVPNYAFVTVRVSSGVSATYEVKTGTANTTIALTTNQSLWTGFDYPANMAMSSGVAFAGAFQKTQRYMYLKHISGTGIFYPAVVFVAPRRLTKGF
jgi:hypothetical protein